MIRLTDVRLSEWTYVMTCYNDWFSVKQWKHTKNILSSVCFLLVFFLFLLLFTPEMKIYIFWYDHNFKEKNKNRRKKYVILFKKNKKKYLRSLIFKYKFSALPLRKKEKMVEKKKTQLTHSLALVPPREKNRCLFNSVNIFTVYLYVTKFWLAVRIDT